MSHLLHVTFPTGHVSFSRSLLPQVSSPHAGLMSPSPGHISSTRSPLSLQATSPPSHVFSYGSCLLHQVSTPPTDHIYPYRSLFLIQVTSPPPSHFTFFRSLLPLQVTFHPLNPTSSFRSLYLPQVTCPPCRPFSGSHLILHF